MKFWNLFKLNIEKSSTAFKSLIFSFLLKNHLIKLITFGCSKFEFKMIMRFWSFLSIISQNVFDFMIYFEFWLNLTFWNCTRFKISLGIESVSLILLVLIGLICVSRGGINVVLSKVSFSMPCFPLYHFMLNGINLLNESLNIISIQLRFSSLKRLTPFLKFEI